MGMETSVNSISTKKVSLSPVKRQLSFVTRRVILDLFRPVNYDFKNAFQFLHLCFWVFAHHASGLLPHSKGAPSTLFSPHLQHHFLCLLERKISFAFALYRCP